MKLIKLLDTHYIIVDDSEIKKGDWYLFNVGYVFGIRVADENDIFNLDFEINPKKIIYSTQPLEKPFYNEELYKISFDKIKPLSLSEVEEVIYGYSVEKMAKDFMSKYPLTERMFSTMLSGNYSNTQDSDGYNLFIKCMTEFHKELVKDKLFTIDDIIKAMEYGAIRATCLVPKTEWNVEFVDGKLKLM